MYYFTVKDFYAVQIGRKIDMSSQGRGDKVQGKNCPNSPRKVGGSHIKTTIAFQGDKFLACWNQTRPYQSQPVPTLAQTKLRTAQPLRPPTYGLFCVHFGKSHAHQEDWVSS